MKWYGNVSNRIEEGHNYTEREPRVGDDITMYLWSDRRCYYISEIISDKKIKVKPYYVCGGKTKNGGMGHQDWVYFKDIREMDKYTGNIHDEDFYSKFGNNEETWVFRYGKWMQEVTYTANPHSDREKKSLEKNGYYKRYFALTGKVSFGVCDYYYDWEF